MIKTSRELALHCQLIKHNGTIMFMLIMDFVHCNKGLSTFIIYKLIFFFH